MEKMAQWVQIKDAPGYEVSDTGLVRSLDRIISFQDGRKRFAKGRVLTPHRDSRGGYLQVQLGRGSTAKVHILVLVTFKGPRPPGMVARHLDGDTENNAPDNLEWGTIKQNHDDTLRHGRTTRGSTNAMSKLSKDDVLEIRRRRLDKKESLRSIAADFPVHESTISRVCNGYRWGWL